MHPPQQRQQLLQQAATTHFDVCIIGGWATGAGCALDAAARGLKVLLIEKEDFGAATSSKSTKLIHGGVRYLEQAVKKASLAQYRMVKKALQERATLLRMAPHITRPLALITPCRTWLEGMYYYVGLKLYDFISGRSHLGRSELLGRKKALQRIPTLQSRTLYNAVLYYDGQLNDLRFNWALIATAIKQGACCINHLAAQGFEANSQGRLTSLLATDALTGQPLLIKATTFINATGPFADSIRQMANKNLAPRIQVSRGVHILLPKHMMPSTNALLIPKTADGRLIFAIPYQKHLLAGTTDDPTTLTAQPFGPNPQEVQYLLNYLNDYLDINAKPSNVTAGFGGLRPLVTAAGQHTKDLVRDHEIETDPHTGLVSVLGGKWTTFRLMAKDAIDSIAPAFRHAKPCTTQHIVLEGSVGYSHTTAIHLQQISQWDHEVVKHLVSLYGTHALAIGQLAQQQPRLKERIASPMPYTWAELQYVLEYEMAFTLHDIIGRRWGVELADWQQALTLAEPVAAFAASWLNWTAAQTQEAISSYQQHIQHLQHTAGYVGNSE